MEFDHTASVFEGALDEALEPLLSAPAWAVGWSGGQDSTVLLHLIQRWSKARGGTPPLYAFHVNHSLQPDAQLWEAHCASLCRDWEVSFKRLSVSVADQASTEAAAREARYSALEAELATLGEGAVLYLAHHLDDQIETFFLRLMRGAGVEGLSGMPASRALGTAQIARPLLGIDAETIAAYARQHALPFVEDPSNCDVHIDRNYLRQDVLPLLESRWPGYRRTVERAVGHLSQARDELRKSLAELPTETTILGDEGVAVRYLQEVSGAESLRAWLRARGLSAPDKSAIDEFLRQLRDGGARSRATMDCGAYTVQRFRDAVFLVPEAPVPENALELAPEQTIALADGSSLSLVSYEVGSELGYQLGGFCLQHDDRLQILWNDRKHRIQLIGREGARTLKSIYQELAVPPWWRTRVPLLALDGELLQIGNLLMCASARWREQPAAGESLWQLRWDRGVKPSPAGG